MDVLDETQTSDNEKQEEVSAPADNQQTIGTIVDEMDLRLELLQLRTEVTVISRLKETLNDRQSRLRIKADAIQGELDGQQSFFEEVVSSSDSSAVQDNKQ